MPPKTERFEMRLDPSVSEQIDGWRARQTDLPSRAEAIRRLVEKAIEVPSRDHVAITDGEKLIAIMLCDIYKKLKIDGEIDHEFVSSAIRGGHYWALQWQLPGLFHGHVDGLRELNEAVDTLDMWSFIEEAWETLPKKQQEQVKAAAQHFGGRKFPGFDGNNEATHRNIADFLVNEMGRFSRFKGRDLNSHYQHLDTYRAMYRVFKPIRATLIGSRMNGPQLIEVLKAGD